MRTHSRRTWPAFALVAIGAVVGLFVLHGVAAGVVLRTFETNAAAWRWIDRQEGSPISPSRGGVGLDREQKR